MPSNESLIFVISGLGSGGAERQCCLLANYFCKSKTVKIIHFDKESIDSFYPLNEKVEVIGLDLLKPSIGFVEKIQNNMNRLLKLRSFLSKQEARTPIVSFMDRTNVLTLLASLGLRKSVYVFERSDPSRQPASVKERLFRDKLYKRAKRIFVQTTSAAEYFGNTDTVDVVPNALSLPIVFDDETADRKHFVCISRMSPEKGVYELVEKFINIKKRAYYPDDKLLLYGEGPDKQKIMELIKDHGLEEDIQIKGVSQDIVKVLNQARGLVLHSQYEGFPNVVLEALSQGTPVLSTPNNGVIDINDQIRSPFLKVSEEDWFEGTWAKMAEVSPNMNDINGLKRQLAELYSVEKVAEKFENLIQK